MMSIGENNESNELTRISEKLWSLLDEVRGYRDIRDLRELFVSLVFLKYANDTYKVNSLNVVEIPNNATWSFLKNQVYDYNFTRELWNAFYVIENANSQLHNVFRSFDFEKILRHDRDLHFIVKLFISISNFNFDEKEIEFSNLFGSILIIFSKYEGKGGVEFYTPNSISQLMVELLNPTQGTVLDSACGTGGFFQKTMEFKPKGKFQFYGQDHDLVTLSLAKLRYAFIQNGTFQFGKPSDTIVQDQFSDLKADYVLMHPPFNIKYWDKEPVNQDSRFSFGMPPKSNANLAWIQHAIYHLNNNGKAAVLLSNGSLSSSGREGQIRKGIIEADLVEAIISLPSQLLTNTSIPSSIWVFNKNKPQKESTLFIDASDLGRKVPRSSQHILDAASIHEISSQFKSWQNNNLTFPHQIGFSNSVSLEEIAENDYQLTPARYVGIGELTSVDLSGAISLGRILKYVRPSRLESNITYKKVSIKDLSTNPDSYLLNTENLSESDLMHNYKLLQNNVLLLSRLGTAIKPTFYTSSKDQVAYSSNNIFAFKVDQAKVSLEYLAAELHKDYIKFQIESYRKGTGIPMIRRDDLLNIQIIVPNLLSQQKEIFELERKDRFQSLAKDLGFEKEIAKLKQAQIKDLGSKKHNIMQHLNNVKSSADVLTKMMEINNGILKSDEVIDPRRGITVERRFLRLQESLSKVIYYVNNITNELKYDDAEIINPVNFLKTCKERAIQKDNFSIEILFEEETFLGREPLISISKNDFDEVFNNILENAVKHGFFDKDKSYIFRVTIACIADNLEIYFENNGKAFPLGISEKYDIKGEKAGTTAGTGIGLWKVAEIAKHFDCKLEVIDDPASEFPVGFKFKFNLETI